MRWPRLIFQPARIQITEEEILADLLYPAGPVLETKRS
jgi:hypothetical protein